MLQNSLVFLNIIDFFSQQLKNLSNPTSFENIFIDVIQPDNPIVFGKKKSKYQKKNVESKYVF